MDGFSSQVDEVVAGGRRARPDFSEGDYAGRMGGLRAEIDECNKGAIDLLARRIAAAKVVAVCKWSAGKPNFDASREQAILEGAGRYAAGKGLPPEYGSELVGLMLKLAREEQDSFRAEIEKRAEQQEL